MYIKEIERNRTERVNEYGVKIVNRLVELQYRFDTTGKIHSKEFYWYRDTIQTNGEKFTATAAHYKQYAAMLRAMNRYHFEQP